MWRFDVENAPRGKTVEVAGPKGTKRTRHEPEVIIVASQDGQTVTLSRWIPNENRWNMLGKNEAPFAWQPFPTHPGLS